jgi:hypothetical protein
MEAGIAAGVLEEGFSGSALLHWRGASPSRRCR